MLFFVLLAAWAAVSIVWVMWLRDWFEPIGVVHAIAALSLVFAGMPLLLLPLELRMLAVDSVELPLPVVLARMRDMESISEGTRVGVFVLLWAVIPCTFIFAEARQGGVTTARALLVGAGTAAVAVTAAVAIGFSGLLLLHPVPSEIAAPWTSRFTLDAESLRIVSIAAC